MSDTARMRPLKVLVQVDGVETIHAGDGTGVYGTLCGLCVDELTWEPVPSHTKITCSQCVQSWQAWKAYRAGDFAPSAFS